MTGTCFWNRKSEIENIEGLLDWDRNKHTRSILYHTQPAVGFTQFLKYIRHSKNKSTIAFYVDGSNRINNSIFSQILIALGTEYQSRWVHYSREIAGNNRGRMILAKVMEGVPYCGPLFHEFIDSNYLSPSFVYSAYPSAASELLGQFLRELAKKNRIVVLIDNIQDIDASSMDLIRATTTGAYGNVRYVLGYVNRSNALLQLDDLRDRVSSLGHDVAETHFPPPDEEFASVMASRLHLGIGANEIQQAVESANGNIYKLLTEFTRYKQLDKSSVDHALRKEPLLQEILWYLTISQQSLRKSDLYNMCSLAPEVFINDISELDQCLFELHDRGLVRQLSLPGGDELVELRGHSDPRTPTSSKDSPRSLLVAERLYDYFSKISESSSYRHSSSELAPLLYRLSKTVAPQDVNDRGKGVLQSVLSSGSIGAAISIYDEATIDSDPSDLNDFVLSAVTKMTVRRYRAALLTLNNAPDKHWEQLEIVRTLKAFCLNRCREHVKSDELIDQLLESVSSLEMRTMLISFKISGKLHQNDIKGAQRIFQQHKDQLKQSQNYGYLLRNAASSFGSRDAVYLLLQAIDIFKDLKNIFGVYTTQNNLGVNYCNLRKYREALECLRESQSGLEIYGVHHLHIVENNLGLVAMYDNNIGCSSYHLKRGILFANEAVLPIVYMKINMALFYALNKESDKSQSLLNQIRPHVESSSFDRMAQRYYLNASLIKAYLDSAPPVIMELSEKSIQHPDRSYPERTIRAASAIKEHIRGKRIITRELLMRLYSPCFLQYWYQNPLELLPDGVLPSYTKSNNMFN